MKTLILSLSLLLLYSCKVSKSSQNNPPPPPMPVQISVIDKTLFDQEAAPIQIDSISISANILTLKFSCAFNPGRLSLVGSPMLAKSFPPIRNCKFVVQESHIKQNKDNEDLFHGVQYFELNPLSHKFVKEAPTYLQIEGWLEKILFIYPE